MFGVRLFGILVAGTALLGAAPRVERGGAPASSVEPTPADTLRYTARAGTPFILGLPPRTSGGEATYRLVEAPALSWLVDRSFFWNVQAGEQGVLPVVFERTVAGSAPEPFVVLVEIEG